MAANIVVITSRKDWKIVQDYLEQLDEGGIIIGPDAAEAIQREMGDEFAYALVGQCVEYDFGGHADIAIDVTNAENVEDMPSHIQDALRELFAENSDEAT